MRVPVATKSHQYEVVLGHQFLTEAVEAFADILQKADKLFVFTDSNVWAAQESTSKQISLIILRSLFCPVVKHAKLLNNIMLLKHFYWNKNAHENHLFLPLEEEQLVI